MSEQSGWYIFFVSRREFHPTDFYGMYELIDLARAALLAADNIRKRMRDSPILPTRPFDKNSIAVDSDENRAS